MEIMNDSNAHLLTVNAGSSSIKLAIFAANNPPKKISEAIISNIGQPSASLVINDQTKPVTAKDHDAAANILLDWLTSQIPISKIVAVGHRVVHGGPKYYKPQVVTSGLLTDLQKLTAFDPEHLPVELQLIETFQKLLSQATQIVCFDTAFHHDLPLQAWLLPLPRRLAAEGVRRYGFHGLSYTYIMEELRRVEGDVAANGKVIIAHLGNGASLAALHMSQPIDTTMSMTPASGIPMSTRSGDLDPGLMLYLANTQGYDAEHFNHLVNFESGLLGISETTGDMKKLLEMEASDERAKDAVDIFCYQVKKTIGGLAAALGGLNTLVFTGGMGEVAPKIRARVCEGLDFLGVTIDAARNQENARLISADGSSVGVHVIRTDEAATIARETAELIQKNK